MSSFKYDKHTLCLLRRDVTYSVDVRCSECSSWATKSMADFLHHRRSLVSKGKKKSVTTPSSSPSVPPSATLSVVSQSPSPSLTSIADDGKIKQYVHSVLVSMLNQTSSQVSLGTNPLFSAPVEVPDIPPWGSTGGRGAECLIRGRIASPSGVKPPSQEDVMPPITVSVHAIHCLV